MLPPHSMLDEPMMRQCYPQVPMWLPQLVQRTLGGEVSTLSAGIAEHAAQAALPITLESEDSRMLSSVMNTFGERVAVAAQRQRARSEGCARSHLSGLASVVGSLLGQRLVAPRLRDAHAQEQQMPT